MVRAELQKPKQQVTTNFGAFAKRCLPKTAASQPWIAIQSIRGQFDDSRELVAILLHHETETGGGSAAVQENPAFLVLMTPTGHCLEARGGYRKPGSLRLPYFESNLERVALEPKRDLLLVHSTYSHGYTEQVSAIFGWFSGSLRELWSGITLTVSPDGSSHEASLTLQDFNGDGFSDLRVTGADAGSGRYVWSQRDLKFKKVR